MLFLLIFQTSHKTYVIIYIYREGTQTSDMLTNLSNFTQLDPLTLHGNMKYSELQLIASI